MKPSGRKKISGVLIVSIVMLCISAALFAMSRTAPTQNAPACTQCHISADPTRGDTRLLPSPMYHTPFRTARFSTAPESANGANTNGRQERGRSKIGNLSNEPDVVLLSEIADKYNPVRFSHKAHADMAQMGESCWLCHHNSPADKPHPACKTCHKIEPDRNNPTVPRLETAYHRHCIDCHRTWSNDKTCTVCHEKKGQGPEISLAKGLPNPYKNPQQPVRVVYETKYNKTKVTFFHSDHTKLFRLACEDCHTNNGCADCHKGVAKTRLIKPGHKTCGGCHDTETKTVCGKCHRKAAMDAFTHNATGFPLGAAHKKLTCDACHHAHKPLSKISTDCTSCHKGLDFNNFDHSKTGFALAPYHTKLACSRCHKSGAPMKAQTTNCVACHKDKIPGFNHNATGFPLSKYHGRVACASCHTSGRSMAVKGTKCTSCHTGLNFRNFDHSQTGFTLKTYHKKLDCSRCHDTTVESFSKPGGTDCATCHKNIPPASFNHASETGVPLGRFHVKLECTSCHTKGFGSTPECKLCHNKDKTWPRDNPAKFDPRKSGVD